MSTPNSLFTTHCFMSAPPSPSHESPTKGEAENPNREKLKVHFGDARRKVAKNLNCCHVCGSETHAAGFKPGSTIYEDCLDMPCYVCKRPGHSTQTCPHRVDPRLGKSAKVSTTVSTQAYLYDRALGGVHPTTFGRGAGWQDRVACALSPHPPSTWRLEAALLRVHTRRVTALTFLPHLPSHATRCVSGDKGGEMGVWQWRGDRGDRTVWSGHAWMVTGLVPDAWAPTGVWSSSCDGTIRLHDLSTRTSTIHASLNGKKTPSSSNFKAAPVPTTADVGGDAPGDSPLNSGSGGDAWKMFYSVAPLGDGTAWAGDSLGCLWRIDARAPPSTALRFPGAHKPQARITAISPHPLSPTTLFATSGNDHCVKVWDARWLSCSGSGTGGSHPPPALATIPLPRSVTNVAFSPHTGKTLAATCLDNRIYTWDTGVWGGGGEGGGGWGFTPGLTSTTTITTSSSSSSSSSGADNWYGDGENSSHSFTSNTHSHSHSLPLPPSSTLVHSHDFARFLSPFRAVWYPADPRERTLVCGRFISESFTARNGQALKLHPIDILDCGVGGGGRGGGQQ